jgi:hypothetical protein
MARSDGPVSGRLALALIVSTTLHGLLWMLPVSPRYGAATQDVLKVYLPGVASPREAPLDPEPALPAQDTASEPSTPTDAPQRASSDTGESGIALPLDTQREPTPLYFTAAELHVRPIPLRRIDLSALQAKFPGQQAKLTLLIDETGRVDDLQIETDAPDFAQAIRSFMADLRFTPGKITDHAVKSKIKLEIRLPNEP